MNYLATATTDIGISKKTNQDSICIKIADTSEYGKIVMAVLCDGMGGLSKGELASATVIRTLVNWFENILPIRLKNYNLQAIGVEWDRMLKESNRHILEYGKKIKNNLGTTVSAMLIIESRYLIVHVGDSRVYQITDRIEQLTEDHTFIAREMKNGTMTQEQALVDPRRNMLLQCVGASREVVPQVVYGDIHPNSVFMLCSDGFRHKISEDEMFNYLNADALTNIDVMNANSRGLIEINKQRMEKDNITVGLVKCIA